MFTICEPLFYQRFFDVLIFSIMSYSFNYVDMDKFTMSTIHTDYQILAKHPDDVSELDDFLSDCSDAPLLSEMESDDESIDLLADMDHTDIHDVPQKRPKLDLRSNSDSF